MNWKGWNEWQSLPNFAKRDNLARRRAAMATMNISLPDTLKKWVERRVKSGNFSNSSDFMRDLVRKEKDHAEYVKWLNSEIDKGLVSDFREISTDAAFAEAHGKASKNLKAKNAA
jgi:antitoxin ParD1/3/4